MVSQVKSIRIQLDVRSSVRQVSENGRDFLVAPVTILVEGVRQGATSPAPELVLASEFGGTPSEWNGKPLLLNHPIRDGEYVTVSTGTGNNRDVNQSNIQSILQNDVIGEVRNARLDGDRLRAEAWFDLARTAANEEAAAVVNAIRDGDPVEISAGYFASFEARPGYNRGKHYAGVQRDIVPDHLAILPLGSTGACSWQDGCGIRAQEARMPEQRLSAQCEKCVRTAREAEPTTETPVAPAIPLSTEQLATSLTAALGDGRTITTVFPDRVVYSVTTEKDGLYWRNYTVADSGVITLIGEPQEVIALADPTPAEDTKPAPEEGTEKEQRMADIKQKVDALVANKAVQWGESDRSWLETLTDEQLDKMVPVEAEPEPKINAEPEPEPEPVTLEGYLSSAPPEIQAVLNESISMRNAKKGELVAQLVANERCRISKERLEEKDIAELEDLVALAGQDIVRHRPAPNDNKPAAFPVMPAIDWGRNGQKSA